MTGLLQCPVCGWYTRELVGDACLRCSVGWIFCGVHGCLEWRRSAHYRVTVGDVLRVLRPSSSPNRSQQEVA